jgi:hypothetical protein
MKWNWVIRQVHRWLSIAFTTGVVIYIVAMRWGRPPGWVGLFPLLPLILLLVTGLYLFMLPYAMRSVRGSRAI